MYIVRAGTDSLLGSILFIKTFNTFIQSIDSFPASFPKQMASLQFSSFKYIGDQIYLAVKYVKVNPGSSII